MKETAEQPRRSPGVSDGSSAVSRPKPRPPHYRALVTGWPGTLTS
jgi:hypothetical protein